MAVVSTSLASQITNPNSAVSTQFSGLRRSFLKLENSVSTQSSFFQNVDSHLRLSSSSRRCPRGVVAMAGSGKVLLFFIFFLILIFSFIMICYYGVLDWRYC